MTQDERKFHFRSMAFTCQTRYTEIYISIYLYEYRLDLKALSIVQPNSSESVKLTHTHTTRFPTSESNFERLSVLSFRLGDFLCVFNSLSCLCATIYLRLCFEIV